MTSAKPVTIQVTLLSSGEWIAPLRLSEAFAVAASSRLIPDEPARQEMLSILRQVQQQYEALHAAHSTPQPKLFTREETLQAALKCMATNSDRVWSVDDIADAVAQLPESGTPEPVTESVTDALKTGKNAANWVTEVRPGMWTLTEQGIHDTRTEQPAGVADGSASTSDTTNETDTPSINTPEDTTNDSSGNKRSYTAPPELPSIKDLMWLMLTTASQAASPLTRQELIAETVKHCDVSEAARNCTRKGGGNGLLARTNTARRYSSEIMAIQATFSTKGTLYSVTPFGIGVPTKQALIGQDKATLAGLYPGR